MLGGCGNHHTAWHMLLQMQGLLHLNIVHLSAVWQGLPGQWQGARDDWKGV